MSLVPVSPSSKSHTTNNKLITTTARTSSSTNVVTSNNNNPRTARLLYHANHLHPRTDSTFLSSSPSHPNMHNTRQLIQSADSEHKSLEVTLKIAEELFTKLIIQGNLSSSSGGLTTHEKQFQESVNMILRNQQQQQRRRGNNSINNNTSSNENDHGSNDDPSNSEVTHNDAFDIGHSRIAISCLFLERLCAVFPRHNAAIRPIAEAIVRSIFVPDTEITRELVGDLGCPIVLKQQDLEGIGADINGATGVIPQEVIELLQPYARKTYAAAFTKISTMLKSYSKTSHSLEIRLKRQAQVFERTLGHWRKTLLRSVFVAWRSTIRRRIFLRAKYRAIFSRLREDESKARAIRLWHQRATRLRKAALADAAMQQEMSKLKVTSESLQQQIVTLLEQNATLSRDVADLERQRQLVTQEMQDRDRFVVDMKHRTSEAERLGTALLNSVLMKHDPPPGITPLESLVRWGHEVIEVHGSIDGNPQPLAPLLSDEYAPQGGNMASATSASVPLSAFGTILGAFDVEGAPPRDAVLQMHINPEAAPQLLVQYYGRVTQRPCIVSEAHLRSRQRGVLLLFLASLMRFASSWMFGPPPLNLREKILEKRRERDEKQWQQQNNNNNNNNMMMMPVSTISHENDNNNLLGVSNSSSTSHATMTMNASRSTPAQSMTNNYNNTSQTSQQQQQAPSVSASAWMDRVRTQQRWVVVSLSAMNAALLIASDRPRILSNEEQEDEDKYCGIAMLSNANLFEDLIIPSAFIEERLPQVIKAIRNAYPEIRKLYLTYSSPTMTMDELWRLLKDSKIVTASNYYNNNNNGVTLSGEQQLTKKKLQSIISLVKRLSHYAGYGNNNNNNNEGDTNNNNKKRKNNSKNEFGPNNSNDGGGTITLTNTDSPTSKQNQSQPPSQSQQQQHQLSSNELSPLHFTIVLLHVALFEHRRQMRLDNPEAVSFETFMLDGIVRTMRDHALRTDVDQFRAVVRHPLVQAVISRHKIALRRVFRKFANCDDGESINRSGFHGMARSCMWMSKTVTIETLNDIFKRVQKAEDVYGGSDSPLLPSPQQSLANNNNNNNSAAETIDLSEWIECLCALATFVFPNPFKPLWEKLGIFVEEKVLVALS